MQNNAGGGVQDVNEPAILKLGPFHVSAEHTDVEVFCRETGFSGCDGKLDGRVPATFPMRWLSLPDIRTVIEAQVKGIGGVAIHESQTFAYEKSLAEGDAYLMTIELEPRENPSRLILRGVVSTLSNELVLRLETILRVFVAETAV